MRDERVRRVGADDPIFSLELHDGAVVERFATENGACERTRVLALDEALDALAKIDSRQCRVVELRFFVGLTIDEAAAALGISTAKAWLFRRLSPPV